MFKVMPESEGKVIGLQMIGTVHKEDYAALVPKVEALVPSDGAARPAEKLSPAEQLARQWREALAANTMGAGAAKQAEEARQRAQDQELRSAQSAWLRLGPVPTDIRKPLQDRFDKAVRRVLDGRRRPVARS